MPWRLLYADASMDRASSYAGATAIIVYLDRLLHLSYCVGQLVFLYIAEGCTLISMEGC